MQGLVHVVLVYVRLLCLLLPSVVDTAAVPAASGSEDIVEKNLDILLEGFLS